MFDRKEIEDVMINEFHEDPEEIKAMPTVDLIAFYNMATDTSSMHPNETFEEFIKNEDY